MMTTYEYGSAGAPIVLIQPVDDHDLSGIENEFAEIQKLTGADLRLLAVKVEDWDHDLSPWQAPAVFGGRDFGDGAEEFLRQILSLCEDKNKTYYIGGYSLAGLFALWAVCRTGVFAGAAAASPSIWFPGFTDYLKEHKPLCGTVYLSLGDREERTRNPVMATVGDRIREAHGWLKEQGYDTTLEWNPGNHFKEPDIRTARAFAWAASRNKLK